MASLRLRGLDEGGLGGKGGTQSNVKHVLPYFVLVCMCLLINAANKVINI